MQITKIGNKQKKLLLGILITILFFSFIITLFQSGKKRHFLELKIEPTDSRV